MNKYLSAKEEVYNALWEVCGCDETTYQNACSGNASEAIMNDIIALAVKLDALSQKLK